MPTDAQVTLSAGQLAQGFCYPASPQDLLNAFIAVMTGVLPGEYSTFNFGPNTPGVDDQDKPWIKTDANNQIIGVYTYNGVWLRPHAFPPSGKSRLIFVGTEAEVWAYDGGDGTDPGVFAPTDTTGAMWKVDHNFDFRLPIGAGTNPVAYGGVNTTILPAGTAGVEKVTIDPTQMPAHSHKMADYFDPATPVKDDSYGNSPVAGSQYVEAESSGPHATVVQMNTSVTGGTGGAAVPMSVLNPVVGVYFISRTARKFYTA